MISELTVELIRPFKVQTLAIYICYTTKKRGKNDACTSAVGQKPLKWALISAVPWLATEMKMAVNNFFFSRQNRAYARL